MAFRLPITIADQFEAMNIGSSAFGEPNELYFDPAFVLQSFRSVNEARKWVADLVERAAEKYAHIIPARANCIYKLQAISNRIMRTESEKVFAGFVPIARIHQYDLKEKYR